MQTRYQRILKSTVVLPYFLTLVIANTAYAQSAEPTVTNNEIQWLDTGDWYQVQNTNDFSEVCGGGTSCLVSDGNYVVINHGTGERFIVDVMGDAGNPNQDTGSAPTVSGNVISWPDNGQWYQVQNAQDNSEVCNGGTSCVVESGNYNVINHATGARYEDIEVGLSINNFNPIELDQLAIFIIYDMAFFQSDDVSGDMLILARIIAEQDAGTLVDFTDTRKVTRHNCNGGGTLTWREGFDSTRTTALSVIEFSDTLIFDQCVVLELEDDSDEQYIVHGMVEKINSNESGDGLTFRNTTTNWEGFSLVVSDDPSIRFSTSYELIFDGGVLVSIFDDGTRINRTRNAAIFEHTIIIEDEVVQSITNSRYAQSSSGTVSGSINRFSLDVSGKVVYESELDKLEVLTIESDPELSSVTALGVDASQNMPLEGNIRISSSDGSVVVIQGNGIAALADEAEPEVKTVFTDSRGNVFVGELESLLELPVLESEF